MKALKKVLIVLLALYLVVVLIVAMVMMIITKSGGSKNSLAGSVADNPERIEELMKIMALGVPADIVMMVTTYGCESDEEPLEKPLIFPALEFLVMTEEVKDYIHDCEEDSYINEDGEEVTTTDHSDCGYKTTQINTYSYKAEIKSYLGISGEEGSSLNAGNLLQLAQAAADKRCHSEQIRIISFGAVWLPDYEDAIKRCGVEDADDIQAFLELHKEGYFTDWLNDTALSLGIGPGESSVIGGSTHTQIGQSIQRPDLVNLAFFGGPAIIPVPAGTYTITSEYGPRDYAPDPLHTGLDFAAASGTPIYSAMDGIVLMRVTNMNSFGHHIVIFHGGGITTMYAHMSAFGQYKQGDSVSSGDIIGYVGTTGLSTGDHLHFEYQRNGWPLNPRQLLS